MDGFAKTGRLVVSEEKHRQARADFASAAVSEEQTVATIREIYERSGYILDPHTAVGVAAARTVGAADAICLATAHPAKFGEAVTGAIGRSVPLPPPFEDLLERESRMAVLPADADAIRSYMIETLRR
jgi:threonine synthase